MSEDLDAMFELQPGDYEAYFKEAIEAAESMYGSLEGTPPEASNPAAELLRELKESKGETAEFSPDLTVLPLHKKQFAEYNLDLSPQISKLVRRYDFYLVRVPITLMPRPGVAFTRLQCIIEFNPGEEDARRPVIHELFPTSKWQTMIKSDLGFSVGLDESLAFKIGLSQVKVERGQLKGEIEASVGPELKASAGLVLGSFNYNIRRPEIISAGEGNVKARWFLDSRNFFEREDLWLGVVVRVPKDIESVNVAGALLAYRNPQWLTGHLADVLELISTKAAQFLRRGAPIEDAHLWRNITKA